MGRKCDSKSISILMETTENILSNRCDYLGQLKSEHEQYKFQLLYGFLALIYKLRAINSLYII